MPRTELNFPKLKTTFARLKLLKMDKFAVFACLKAVAASISCLYNQLKAVPVQAVYFCLFAIKTR